MPTSTLGFRPSRSSRAPRARRAAPSIAVAALCLGFAAPVAAQSPVVDVVAAHMDAAPAASPYQPDRAPAAAPSLAWDDDLPGAGRAPSICGVSCERTSDTRAGRSAVEARPPRNRMLRYGTRKLRAFRLRATR